MSVKINKVGNDLIWKKIGNDIIGEGSEDNAGQEISISSDGKVIAIGAPFNDGNGNSNLLSATGAANQTLNYNFIASNIAGGTLYNTTGTTTGLNFDNGGFIIASSGLHTGNVQVTVSNVKITPR